MIHSFEELGDVLADFENRIAYLENSQPYNPPEPKEVRVNKTVYLENVTDGEVQRLKAEVANLKAKLYNHITESIDKKKKGYVSYK